MTTAVGGMLNMNSLTLYCSILGPSEGLLMPANGYQNGTNGMTGNSVLLAPGLTPGGYGSFTPSMQLSVNTVDAVTESIKSDRTIRMWKVEAMKVSETSLLSQMTSFLPEMSK